MSFRIPHWIFLGMCLFLFLSQDAFAASDATPNATFPYTDTFAITGYYSPLPDQEFFITGDYESEIRLNGRGVRGADRTEVYPGMVAAPPKYPYDTKMKIPGVGTVAVHDRGGAIVESGERGQSHDRLDIWMGQGTEGLFRALTWGKKVLDVVVFGVNQDVREEVYLETFAKAEDYIRNVIFAPKLFTEDLWYKQQNDDVKRLQEYMRQLGYYHGAIDGYYGDSVLQAVFAFQVDQKLVDSWEDIGAGHFGVSTRRALDRAVSSSETAASRVTQERLPEDLGSRMQGENVRKLQEILIELGYLKGFATGVYDEKTVDAVLRFQKENGIILDNTDPAAGYVGPKTRAMLSQKLLAIEKQKKEKLEIALQTYPDLKEESPFFLAPLGKGDRGEKVVVLQEELARLNYLRISPTGYFGDVTEHALFKLQQAWGIVDEKNDSGSGYLGPLTRSRLNTLIAKRRDTKQAIALARVSRDRMFAEKEATIALTE